MVIALKVSPLDTLSFLIIAARHNIQVWNGHFQTIIVRSGVARAKDASEKKKKSLPNHQVSHRSAYDTRKLTHRKYLIQNKFFCQATELQYKRSGIMYTQESRIYTRSQYLIIKNVYTIKNIYHGMRIFLDIL